MLTTAIERVQKYLVIAVVPRTTKELVAGHLGVPAGVVQARGADGDRRQPKKYAGHTEVGSSLYADLGAARLYHCLKRRLKQHNNGSCGSDSAIPIACSVSRLPSRGMCPHAHQLVVHVRLDLNAHSDRVDTGQY